jgi:hypothetical protein
MEARQAIPSEIELTARYRVKPGHGAQRRLTK